MLRPSLALFFLLCTCVLAAQLPRTTPEQAGFSPERLARLDGWLQGLVDDGIIPNAQAMILRRGEVVYQNSFGYADLESRKPAGPDAIYRIASQTKALVTVGLMMEYERGKLLLEDPVEKYIPAFAGVRVLKEQDGETGEYFTEKAKRSITIRDLLAHTSGISYGLPIDETGLEVPFFASLEADRLEDVVDRIAERPLLHHPGEGFTYGLSTDVAGRVLEIISGQRLDEYLRAHIFEPLKMRDSYFYLPAGKHDRLVSLYSKSTADGPLTLHENATYRDFALRGAQTYYSGGAGSVGTIEDYARFCQMLLNGGELEGARLLSPKTIDFMVRNHIGEAEVWDRRDKFGLGFMVVTPGSRYADQATPGSFKWGGMYCSEYTIDPAEELVMLFYTNVHPIPQYSEIVRKFRILVYGALVE